MPKECKTIRDKQNTSFDTKVNEALADGWELRGGLAMCERGYYAVILTRDRPAPVEEADVPTG